jgi:hypothetical protein
MSILTWPIEGPDLNAVAALTGSGLVERLGTGQWTVRQLETVDPNRISITRPDGVPGNPLLDVGPDVVLTTNTYDDPSWLNSLAWSKITGTPTSCAGYGIVNGDRLDAVGAAVTDFGLQLLACANGDAVITLIGLNAAKIRAILGVTQKSIGYCDSGTPTTSTFLVS